MRSVKLKIKARVNFLRWTFLGLILMPFAVAISGCAVEESDISSGLFVDAPVEGLMFESGSLIGRTDAEGRFYYETGSDVTFSIEGIEIATIQPKDFVTPFDLVSSTAFVSDTETTNISRFIQSLDIEDGNPDDGITISAATRADFYDNFSSLNFLSFTGTGFDTISSFFTGGFRSPVAAQTHLLASLAQYGRLSIDLINLGDGFTAGMQSSIIEIPDVTDTATVNLHQFTQSKGYANLLASQIRSVFGANLTWSSPTLQMDGARNKTRTSVDVIPYNLAVPGATSKTLVEGKTGSANLILDALMLPIQNNWSTAYPGGVSQLDAAKLLAGQDGHEQRLKLFTVWIGLNDVLGALTQGGGALLDQASIDSYLLDPAHDIATVKTNISTTVTELSAVDDSYVFIATLPDVTKMGTIYYREDIKSLAQFDNVSATGLENYSTAGPSDVVAIGPYAFAHYSDTSGFGLSRNLASDNDTLDNAISDIILNDLYSLTWTEVDFIRTRIEAINTYIQSFADPDAYPKVFVVDIHGMFEELSAGSIQVGTDTVERRFGGGFFSMDGVYPSNTGYGLIAKEFIERIGSPFTLATSDASYSNYTAYVNEMGINADNGIGINIDPESLDLAGIWSGDPYRDIDGDGFPAGPDDVILSDGSTDFSVDPSLDLMQDCSDYSILLLPEAISGTACGL